MKRIICIVLIMCLLVGCGAREKNGPKDNEETKNEPTLNKPEDYKQFEYPQEGDICADIYILDYGHILVKLFTKETPYACDNFIAKAKKNQYDGTSISGFAKDYYIQAGKPLSVDDKEESIWGGGFSNEIVSDLKPARGAMCMANQGTDGTNAMEFFFVTTKASTINGLDLPLRERYGMSFKEYLDSKYGAKFSDSELNFYYTYGGAPWIEGRNTVFGQVFEGFEIMDKIEQDLSVSDKQLYIKKVTIYEHV